MTDKKLTARQKALLVTADAPRTQPEVAATGEYAPAHHAKTAPGQLMAFMEKDSSHLRELNELKDKLQSYDGAAPTKLIDAKLITPSGWANRHEDSFKNKAFKDFCAEIGAAGGNIQPIKIRPIKRAGQFKYEIIFGHRRHRACLDLDLPVLATIEATDDVTLFEHMERENRLRQDLSLYEKALSYKRALDQKLYPNQTVMANALGVNRGGLNRCVVVAGIDPRIINALPSPLDLTWRRADALLEATDGNPDIVLNKAIEIIKRRAQGDVISATQAMAELTASSEKPSSITPQRRVVGEGQKSFTVSVLKDSTTFSIPTDNGKIVAAIEAAIEKALQRLRT